MGRWHGARKGNRRCRMIGQPPVPPVKRRNGCTIEERQAMQLRQDVRDFVIASVDLTNPIGERFDASIAPARRRHLRQCFARSMSLSEKPLARAHASAAASPYWATARLTTRQEIVSAGDEANSPASSKVR